MNQFINFTNYIFKYYSNYVLSVLRSQGWKQLHLFSVWSHIRSHTKMSNFLLLHFLGQGKGVGAA
jgi:hypothetical protein